MKVVLDTNVLISGIFFGGPPLEILGAWKDGRIELLISNEVLDEYQRVAWKLAEKLSDVDVERILQIIRDHSILVSTSGVSVAVCSDPDDDKFIECAIAGNADVIVSGDRHLLEIGMYESTPIITPRAFLDQFLDQ